MIRTRPSVAPDQARDAMNEQGRFRMPTRLQHQRATVLVHEPLSLPQVKRKHEVAHVLRERSVAGDRLDPQPFAVLRACGRIRPFESAGCDA